MVLMLCSPAASYMTGQTYHLDGGCLAGGTPWDFDTKYATTGPAVLTDAAAATDKKAKRPTRGKPGRPAGRASSK